MTSPDSLEKVVADIRTYAQAQRTSPTCSCGECSLCAWLAIDPETFADRIAAMGCEIATEPYSHSDLDRIGAVFAQEPAELAAQTKTTNTTIQISVA